MGNDELKSGSEVGYDPVRGGLIPEPSGQPATGHTAPVAAGGVARRNTASISINLLPLPKPSLSVSNYLSVGHVIRLMFGMLFLVAGLFVGYLDMKDGSPSGLGVGETGGLLFISGTLIDPATTKLIVAEAVDALRGFFGKDKG